ncbi:MAG: hypothetical protein HY049_15605 [Acidobacteria bacterium]|nr:hypothetical protein [Acidobacteriota bacterium]
MFERKPVAEPFPSAVLMMASTWGVLWFAMILTFAGYRSFKEATRVPTAGELACATDPGCIDLGQVHSQSVIEEGALDVFVFGTPVMTVVAAISARRSRRRGIAWRRLLVPWGTMATMGCLQWGWSLVSVLRTFP